MSPFIVFLMIHDEVYYKLISFFLILCVSLTDALDGYYARKYNLVSKLGKYLDPIADKFFILSVLFTLHYLLDSYIPLWMIMIIFLRDILVTFLRNIFQKKKLEFRTSRLAKNKTLVQIISIHIIVLLMIINEYNIYFINYSIFYYIMLFCSLLTMISGLDYCYQYYTFKNNE
tara:strand:+ start:76 stop:594 length:519 start_codon:yes stop_codon:yes gene_type:complete